MVEDSEPAKKCCKDGTAENCPELKDAAWSCSSAYSDKDYALTFCPFKKKKCGDTAEITFGEGDVNKTNSIKVANLAAGESCSFKIKAQCNSPAFQALQDAKGFSDANTVISFVEYKKSFVKPSSKDKRDGTETSDERKTTMPDDDKPPRDLALSDMGNLAKKNCEAA